MTYVLWSSNHQQVFPAGAGMNRRLGYLPNGVPVSHVFPAGAGMNRGICKNGVTCVTVQGVPRGCGDEPSEREYRSRKGKCSPRVRG